MRCLTCLLLLMLLSPSWAETTWSDPDGSGPLPAAERVAGRLVVDLKGTPTAADLALWGALHDLSPVATSVHGLKHGLVVVEVEEARVPELLERLSADPLVECVAPDYIVHSTAMEMSNSLEESPEPSKSFPNDPLFKYQWHHDMVGARKAWKKASGEGVTIALLDTGVAYTSKGSVERAEDLAETRFVKGYDFINDDPEPVDDNGIGTHMAGTLAQSTNNNLGVAGLAYKASLMPVKVLDARGSGSFSGIADGILFAADNGADILTMGFGSSSDHELLHKTLMYAHEKGCLLVAAGGVSGGSHPGYPADYEEVLSVGSVGRDGRVTRYSNGGVDMVAPGGYGSEGQGILQNTFHRHRPSRGGYLWHAGSNCAAAHVVGAAALVMSQGVKDPAQVRQLLLSTADKRKDKKSYGAGILRADKAVAKASGAHGKSSCPWLLSLFLGLGLWVWARRDQG